MDFEELVDQLSGLESQKKIYQKKHFYSIGYGPQYLIQAPWDSILEMQPEKIEPALIRIFKNGGSKPLFTKICEEVFLFRENDLAMLCCEFLMSWPGLSSMQLELDFDVLDAVLNHQNLVAKCALAQLFVCCDAARLRFLDMVPSFVKGNVAVCVGTLLCMNEEGFIEDCMMHKLVNYFFGILWDFSGPEHLSILAFIRSGITFLDIKNIEVNLAINERERSMLALFQSIASSCDYFGVEECTTFVQEMLEVASSNCIYALPSVVSFVEDFCFEEYFVEYIIRLIELAPELKEEVVYVFERTYMPDGFASKLMEIYPACFALVPFALDLDDGDEFVQQCLNLGDVEGTLYALVSSLDQNYYLDIMMRYVGVYEVANVSLFPRMKSLNVEQYIDIVIPQCLQTPEMEHSLEFVVHFFQNTISTLSFCERVWASMETVWPSYERTLLMMMICKYVSYRNLVFRFFHGWVPYLFDIAMKGGDVLDNLPLHFFKLAMIHLTEYPGRIKVKELIKYTKSKQFLKLISDYAVDSNDFYGLWDIAHKYDYKYASRMAWKYMPKLTNCRSIYHVLTQNGSIPPADSVTERLLNQAFTDFTVYDDDNFCEVAAYLVNNTGVDLNTDFFTNAINKTENNSLPALVRAVARTVAQLNDNHTRIGLVPVLVGLLLVCPTEELDLFWALHSFGDLEEMDVVHNTFRDMRTDCANSLMYR